VALWGVSGHPDVHSDHECVPGADTDSNSVAYPDTNTYAYAYSHAGANSRAARAPGSELHGRAEPRDLGSARHLLLYKPMRR
jgi:hypothetical protein